MWRCIRVTPPVVETKRESKRGSMYLSHRFKNSLSKVIFG